jgi:hypothetical protein
MQVAITPGIICITIQNNKTNPVAFGPQVIYTNWATAAGRRILLPT